MLPIDPKAVSMAAKTTKDSSKFKVGDRVIANNDCYCHEPGEVVNHETNMIGLPLVIVQLDSGGETCFYRYELKKEGPKYEI